MPAQPPLLRKEGGKGGRKEPRAAASFLWGATTYSEHPLAFLSLRYDDAVKWQGERDVSVHPD